ncbi:MAG: tRNA (N(6)-L-threonylcarbamoyladenosine(37)-C(2))-methylthiotransferase MtaB [Deltaproteobacteria bacterium]|nr:MAG: tRNA (N(6)-L-threonylcarbamoyladenosine(37)-C(2))-methylthiotransferase MtaB [Deltaproteobacteria bacterium]
MNHFFIQTLGCKVNQYESDAIAQMLISSGWIRTDAVSEADACILNTCAVTGRAGVQSRQAARRLIRSAPQAVIVITGCYTQIASPAISDITGVHAIIDHRDKPRICEQVHTLSLLPPERRPQACALQRNHCDDTRFLPFPVVTDRARTRQHLKIQDGCNAFCTYCIVPYTRGRSRSMAADEVVSQVRGLAASQCREVILAGIHLGMYGHDLHPPTDLAAITRRMLSETNIPRIRFGSIEPAEVTDELLVLAENSPRICRHFHVPLQNGDDTLLKQMKRPYDFAFFSERIREIHSRIPSAAIGIDVMVGFPGESDAAFERTRERIAGLPISHLHVFPFSPRPGTPAAGFPDPVPGHTASGRARLLRELGAEKTHAFATQALSDGPLKVLFEKTLQPDGRIRGVSDHYLTVFAPGDPGLKNRIVNVTGISVAADGSITGRVTKGKCD